MGGETRLEVTKRENEMKIKRGDLATLPARVYREVLLWENVLS
jgi:hypothetical protein